MSEQFSLSKHRFEDSLGLHFFDSSHRDRNELPPRTNNSSECERKKRNARNFNCLIKLGLSFSGREGKTRQMNKLGCWRGELNWIKRILNEFKCSRGSQFHKLTRIDLHQTFPLQNNSGNSIFLVFVVSGWSRQLCRKNLCLGAKQYEERQNESRRRHPASFLFPPQSRKFIYFRLEE